VNIDVIDMGNGPFTVKMRMNLNFDYRETADHVNTPLRGQPDPGPEVAGFPRCARPS